MSGSRDAFPLVMDQGLGFGVSRLGFRVPGVDQHSHAILIMPGKMSVAIAINCFWKGTLFQMTFFG